jgi:hypothetical protein
VPFADRRGRGLVATVVDIGRPARDVAAKHRPMPPRAVALLGLLWTAAGCACGPERGSTDWSAYRGRSDALRAMYLGLEPSLRPTTADVALGPDGARTDPRCEATRGPRVGSPGELAAIVDRAHALRARQRLLDQVDAALQAGAADTDSATAILREVVDRLDLAAAMLDRLPDRTM